jgi:hypothetical protein
MDARRFPGHPRTRARTAIRPTAYRWRNPAGGPAVITRPAMSPTTGRPRGGA